MSGGRNHPSFIPKPTHRDHPTQSIPGAYPDTPKVLPGDHLSSKEGSGFKAQRQPENHEGHDHRPLKKVDLPSVERPSGSREGVGSLPAERKPASQNSHVIEGSGYNNNRAIEQLYASQTMDCVNPIPPPNRRKDSTQPIPIIISDADDLQNQNPIPPPSHDTYRAATQPSEQRSSFITTGKNAPHSLESKRSEYDMHGDHLDTEQFIYDDDMSMDNDVAISHIMLRAKQAKKPHYTGELGSTSTSTRSAPEDRRTAMGHNGVEYYLDGKDGVLPGYPTPKGMNTLVGNRINDDRIHKQHQSDRHEEVCKLDHMIRGESATNNQAGSTSGSDVYDIADNDENRIIEEKRETPVFHDGSQTAAGKYDATFEPVTGRADEPARHQSLLQDQKQVSMPLGRHYKTATRKFPFPDALSDSEGENANRNIEERQEVPIFRDGSDTASGRFEAIYAPVTGNPEDEHPAFGDQNETNPSGQFEPTFVSNRPLDSKNKERFEGRADPRGWQEAPAFRGSGDNATPKFEAVSRPETGHPRETKNSNPFRQTSDRATGRFQGTGQAGFTTPQPTSNQHGSPTYLGKPILKAEEDTQIERARMLARKRAGLN